MRKGFRVTYFGVNGEDGTAGALPDCLLCDDTLEESLDKIKAHLRTLILREQSRDLSEESFVSFNLSIYGPFPEDGCFVDRRTAEERLADADSPEERLSRLGEAAISRLEAEDLAAARAHVEELEALLPDFREHPYFNDSEQKVHLAKGRLALREGNVEEARSRLMKAASSEGSPTMCSFGPNMTLARDMLLAGERQIVLDYFEACRKFWASGSDELDEWTMYVNAGRMPDFGANLQY